VSTCPECGVHLIVGHDCRGRRNRRWVLVLIALAGASGGVLTSILLPRHQGLLASEPTLAVVGAIIAVALWRRRVGWHP
jgi:hypothetical protein